MRSCRSTAEVDALCSCPTSRPTESHASWTSRSQRPRMRAGCPESSPRSRGAAPAAGSLSVMCRPSCWSRSRRPAPNLGWRDTLDVRRLNDVAAIVILLGLDGHLGRSSEEGAMNGFGWSFYGFFVAAGVWLACYFVWAFRAAARERETRPMSTDSPVFSSSWSPTRPWCSASAIWGYFKTDTRGGLPRGGTVDRAMGGRRGARRHADQRRHLRRHARPPLPDGRELDLDLVRPLGRMGHLGDRSSRRSCGGSARSRSRTTSASGSPAKARTRWRPGSSSSPTPSI